MTPVAPATNTFTTALWTGKSRGPGDRGDRDDDDD